MSETEWSQCHETWCVNRELSQEAPGGEDHEVPDTKAARFLRRRDSEFSGNALSQMRQDQSSPHSPLTEQPNVNRPKRKHLENKTHARTRATCVKINVMTTRCESRQPDEPLQTPKRPLDRRSTGLPARGSLLCHIAFHRRSTATPRKNMQ